MRSAVTVWPSDVSPLPPVGVHFLEVRSLMSMMRAAAITDAGGSDH
jgi:hypothetical protein